MDRTPLWEGRLRLWISALGASLDDGSTGETRHEEDLPLCCRTEAARNATQDPEQRPERDSGFECAVCGAAWQAPLAVEPEFDAFAYSGAYPDETEGAA